MGNEEDKKKTNRLNTTKTTHSCHNRSAAQNSISGHSFEKDIFSSNNVSMAIM